MIDNPRAATTRRGVVRSAKSDVKWQRRAPVTVTVVLRGRGRPRSRTRHEPSPPPHWAPASLNNIQWIAQVCAHQGSPIGTATPTYGGRTPRSAGCRVLVRGDRSLSSPLLPCRMHAGAGKFVSGRRPRTTVGHLCPARVKGNDPDWMRDRDRSRWSSWLIVRGLRGR